MDLDQTKNLIHAISQQNNINAKTQDGFQVELMTNN
jgi:hypothetical protein